MTAGELELAVAALKREDRRGDDARALVDMVDDVAPDAETPPELLALTVGRAYGIAMAQRDQARQVADQIAGRLAEALTHLRVALDALPEQASSFAKTNDELNAARVWLTMMEETGAVDSAESPEQKGQP